MTTYSSALQPDLEEDLQELEEPLLLPLLQELCCQSEVLQTCTWPEYPPSFHECQVGHSIWMVVLLLAVLPSKVYCSDLVRSLLLGAFVTR